MRNWPIRPRLAVLTAAIVALAIVGASVLAWTATRETLRSQIDDSLKERSVFRVLNGTDPDDTQVMRRAQPLPPTMFTQRMCRDLPVDEALGVTVRVQLILADKSICVPGRNKPYVEPTSAERAVATTGEGEVLRDGTTPGGEDVRVLTRSMGDGAATQAVRSLAEVDSSLRRLAWILAGASLLGVLAAALAGFGLARYMLRPVERLTAAAEHVAETDDLEVPLDDGLARTRDEVSRLGHAFNAMMTRLAGSRRRQQQLVADASHELRTPVTSLRTNVEWLMRSDDAGRPVSPDQRRRIERAILGQVDELSHLIGDLSEVARGGVPDEVESMALDEVALRAVERAQHRDPTRQFELDLTEVRIDGHAAGLERAILNLLDNALKFSAGPIGLTVHESEVSVADRGEGLTDVEREQAFERFWRADGARELPGSGLGLAIVADVARRHGGEPFFRARSGGGSVVGIAFPTD